ncbi:hypothetical protein H2201_005885 [Coniosporium apollinis]|uniref:Uncharacterized protein n=1 Tax=Coniosporium apollinis TaxID=61459 RepID=A0ABQ9NP73_9PEZI|nr:hypothetical protein H2201_005885 [Coniosporium apollinis]
MASDEPESVWPSDHSTVLAIVAAVLYLIPTCVLCWETIIRYRSWFFSCVVFGSGLEVGGYIARAVSTRQVDQIPPYAVQSSLIILAPIFIAAGNYLLIGRLIRAVLVPSRHRILGLRADRITRTFVICDIISFLIQVSGSGLASSGDWEGDTATTGINVLIGGLATQVATFGFFLLILSSFHAQTLQHTRRSAPRGWRRIFIAICISSALIMIRCVYRVVEFAMGIEGYPFTHEWMFYVFESLPMLPAIAVFCLFHPAECLGSHGGRGKEESSDTVSDLALTNQVA